MATQQPMRKSYLVTITTSDPTQKTAMRNALWRLGGQEILPGLYLVALTPAEHQALARRFGGMRVRAR